MEDNILDFISGYCAKNAKDEVSFINESLFLLFNRLCLIKLNGNFSKSKVMFQCLIYERMLKSLSMLNEIDDDEECMKILNIFSRLFHYVNSVNKGEPLLLDELMKDEYGL